MPKDENHHDVVYVGNPRPPQPLGWLQGVRVRADEPIDRPRRHWLCRMRLIARSPSTGKILSPTSPQRLNAAGGAAYVRVDLLEKGLV